MGGCICFRRVSLLPAKILRPRLSMGKYLVFRNGWYLELLRASGFMGPMEIQNSA